MMCDLAVYNFGSNFHVSFEMNLEWAASYFGFFKISAGLKKIFFCCMTFRIHLFLGFYPN